MAKSVIEFSGDFGGRDAAAVVLPHFRALKAAAEGVEFAGFPFARLGFVLRVDGEVTQFRPTGLSNPEMDRGRECFALDIGIAFSDRAHLRTACSEAIRASYDFIIAALAGARIGRVDEVALKRALELVAERYLRASVEIGRS